MEDEKNNIRFTIDMPRNIHRDLKIYCAENDEKMCYITSRAITEYLENRKDGRQNRRPLRETKRSDHAVR